jgi:hypothetical protein
VNEVAKADETGHLWRIFALVLAGTLLATASVAGPLLGPRTVLNDDAASDSASDRRPAIAQDGKGNWVAVWWAREVDPPHTDTIRTARSSDDGASWTSPVNIPAPSGSRQPSLATDGDGTWMAIWSSNDSLGGTIGIDGDLFVTRSTDDGATWSPPAPFSDNASTDSGNDGHNFTERPVIVAGGQGTWLALWSSYEDVGGVIGTDGDVLFSRSTDGGLSWSSPAAIDPDAGTDSEDDWGISLATDGNGTWAAVWWKGEGFGDSDIWISRSLDDGAAFTPAARVEAGGPDGSRDFSPSIATDGRGSWLVAWSAPPPGSAFEILVARSTDECATFMAPSRIRSGVGGPYHEGEPHLSVSDAGSWVVAWELEHYRDIDEHLDTEVFFARSFDAGASWGAPAPMNENPWVDASWDTDAIAVPGRGGVWRGVWITDGEIEPGISTADFDIAIVQLDIHDLPTLSPLGALLLVAGLLIAGRLRLPN